MVKYVKCTTEIPSEEYLKIWDTYIPYPGSSSDVETELNRISYEISKIVDDYDVDNFSPFDFAIYLSKEIVENSNLNKQGAVYRSIVNKFNNLDSSDYENWDTYDWFTTGQILCKLIVDTTSA